MLFGKLNYQILGNTAQVLEVNLEPDKTLIADGGSLLYLDEEINFVLRDDDGADEVKEKPVEEDEPEPLPSFVNKSTEMDWHKSSPLADIFAEPEREEEEKEAGLLEKIWSATKKTIGKFTKIGEKKVDSEEDEGAGFDWHVKEENPAKEEAKIEPINEKAGKTFSWYLTHFTNESDYIRKVAFTTTTAGVIVAIDLEETFENELVIQTGTFLCARKGTRLTTHADTGISVNFLKEKFFKLDKLSGKDFIFLRVEGNVMEKELVNDAIRINLFSLVAFESSLELDTKNIKHFQSMNYEDETIFATLLGTGKYWLQTANIQHLIYRISPFIFEPSETSSGEEIIQPIPTSNKPNKQEEEQDDDPFAHIGENHGE